MKHLAPLRQHMVKDWRIRKRKPVRRKHVAPLLKRLEEHLEIDLNVEGGFLEMAEYGPWQVVIIDRVAHIIEVESPEGERVVFLTLRGLLERAPDKKFVEVDHGAIPFLMNGADCMVAGVHAADSQIEVGDLIWIRDQSHARPLALGWALMDGPTLVSETKGRGIKTIHHVGDELWEMEL